jgi:hypothetical protein
LYEVHLTRGDREIDWIEIRLATETTSEIRLAFDVRYRFVAAGTEKDESAVSTLVWPVQVLDEPIDRNLIA